MNIRDYNTDMAEWVTFTLRDFDERRAARKRREEEEASKASHQRRIACSNFVRDILNLPVEKVEMNAEGQIRLPSAKAGIVVFDFHPKFSRLPTTPDALVPTCASEQYITNAEQLALFLREYDPDPFADSPEELYRSASDEKD